MEADAGRPDSLRCSSCGAPIFWTLTPKGARMPMDAEPAGRVPSRHYVVLWPDNPAETPRTTHAPYYHASHFATCPHAAQHRRR